MFFQISIRTESGTKVVHKCSKIGQESYRTFLKWTKTDLTWRNVKDGTIYYESQASLNQQIIQINF
jgi:hypothetical protein